MLGLLDKPSRIRDASSDWVVFPPACMSFSIRRPSIRYGAQFKEPFELGFCGGPIPFQWINDWHEKEGLFHGAIMTRNPWGSRRGQNSGRMKSFPRSARVV